MLTISPTHSSALQQPAVCVELGARAFSLPSSSTTFTCVGREAERTGALLGVAVDGDAALGRAVRVDHLDAEPAAERLDDLGRALVAERDAQRVVGVVGLLGLREEVRERLARVVEVGRAVAADVGQPARRARTGAPSPTAHA